MIIDHPRDLKEFKRFYMERPMNDGIFSFNFIVNNPHLYCFYSKSTGELKGYINIYRNETGNLFLSGAAKRKILPDIKTAIITVCNAFNEDMYAETDKKEAKMALLRAGFKKINENLYVRYKNG
jgi:hypothetical protein